MIVSASYRTDIPAFYGEWFIRRVRTGYCKVVNPYSGQLYQVSLSPDDVDGFIFWTKNIGPFLERLSEIRQRGYPFVVQYGMNGYPGSLERSVPDPGLSVTHMQRLAATFGPHTVVWRYDPVVLSTLTPLDFHRRNFADLARRLEGSTDEVTISFAHSYRKTKRNMDQAAAAAGFTWEDPDCEWKKSLALELAMAAQAYGMRLTVCSQPQYLSGSAGEARCVDAGRLAAVAGRDVSAPLKGNRPDCGCNQSRDIGAYDTCPHGCMYCYAVQDHSSARQRFRRHDPDREFL